MSADTIERSDRARIDNIRYSKPGRPRGMADLSQEKKAAIVADKILHVFSHPSIAKKHNVSRQTVLNMSEDDLSNEGKKHLQTFVDKLSDIREETSDLLLEKIRDKSIKDGVLPQLLNIANQNYRLETNQSTSNIAVKVQDELADDLIAKGWDEVAAREQAAKHFPD